jgi:predicted CXXCH cytochrome family protein
MTILPTNPKQNKHQSSHRFLAILMAVVIAIVLISCATVNRIVLAPPQIPGATFVGTESCETCHEEVNKDFKSATHSRLMAPGKNAEHMGCEGCHGPGSLHVESGGKKGTIVNPRKSPETCYQCHLDKQGEFSLPHHHPVPEGKMSCGDCHNPHKGNAIPGGGTSVQSMNDTCFHCHTAQKGPFIYEHEAVREGCTTCHAVHGSVNPRMLTERDSNLCLKCHFQQQTVSGQLVIGGRNHNSSLSQGSCFSGDCHEGVHGSNVNSSQRR